MEKTVTIYLFGKKYEVPGELTIMSAMEYCGYTLVRGCGCRGGFCGSCLTMYRIGETGAVKSCLACRTQVCDEMYIAAFSSFPLKKKVYDLERLTPEVAAIKQLYPEIDRCIGCNACTKICPQGLDVRGYIAAARAGDLVKCAEKSFACVMCGACSAKCPAGIPQAQVALLVRRLNGKYLSKKSEHLEKRVKEAEEGTFFEEVKALTDMPVEELKELYKKRDFEK